MCDERRGDHMKERVPKKGLSQIVTGLMELAFVFPWKNSGMICWSGRNLH